VGSAARWLMGMLLGCSPGVNNSSPAETDCGEHDELVLAPYDDLSSGVTAEALLAPLLEGPLVYHPAWADGVERELVVTAHLVGDTVFAQTFSECPELDRVEATVVVTLATEDGLFDETWTQNIQQYNRGGRIDLSFDIFGDQVAGSFDLQSWAAEAQSVILWMGVGSAQPTDDGGYLQARMSREDEFGASQRVGLCGWGSGEDNYQPVDTIDTGL